MATCRYCCKSCRRSYISGIGAVVVMLYILHLVVLQENGTHFYANKDFSHISNHIPLALACNAWSRSHRISSMFSMPTERRIRSGVTPPANWSTSESCWCVVLAG